MRQGETQESEEGHRYPPEGRAAGGACRRQIRDSTAGVLEAFKRILDADKLAIHAEDRLLIIPWPSVKYVELIPPPLTVPFGTVQKARIVGRTEDVNPR